MQTMNFEHTFPCIAAYNVKGFINAFSTSRLRVNHNSFCVYQLRLRIVHVESKHVTFTFLLICTVSAIIAYCSTHTSQRTSFILAKRLDHSVLLVLCRVHNF